MSYRFIVLTVTSACLHQYEAFGTFDVFLIQCTTLAVLNSKVIRCPIDELKRRQNFGELPFGLSE